MKKSNRHYKSKLRNKSIFSMEPLSYVSMTIIMIAIFLMAAQNMSMLSGKWRNYYVGILLLKLLVTYVNAFYPGTIPMSGVDGWRYANIASRVLASSNGFFGIFRSEETLFIKETAAVFYFIGINRVYMYYIVCFCSLIAFKYMVLMAKEMTENDELAQQCGILFLTWPILLLHASTFLRENQCNLLFILSFYNFVRFVKKHDTINFVSAIFWAVLAAMTHSGMIALVVCYCIFGSMVSKSGEIKFSPVKIVFGFVLVLGLMSSPFSDSMTEKFKGAEGAQSVQEFTDTVATEQTEEAATQYIASRPSNPIKLLLLEPYLFLMLIFSPLPYQVHNVGQGISFLIESIPQFFIVRATYLYLVVERKNGTSQIKGYKTMGLWTLLLFYFIFSLGTTCYGTAIRHRAKITPMLIVFATMYYAERKGVAVGTKEEEKTTDVKRKVALVLYQRLRKIVFGSGRRRRLFTRRPRFPIFPMTRRRMGKRFFTLNNFTSNKRPPFMRGVLPPGMYPLPKPPFQPFPTSPRKNKRFKGR